MEAARLHTVLYVSQRTGANQTTTSFIYPVPLWELCSKAGVTVEDPAVTLLLINATLPPAFDLTNIVNCN